RVLGLAHAPDVALRHVVFEHRVAVGIGDAHHAVGGDLEGLVVGAVFLGLVRHQTDVGHAAHGGRVECAIGLAVLNHHLIHGGIAAVGDDCLAVLTRV